MRGSSVCIETRKIDFIVFVELKITTMAGVKGELRVSPHRRQVSTRVLPRRWVLLGVFRPVRVTRFNEPERV